MRDVFFLCCVSVSFVDFFLHLLFFLCRCVHPKGDLYIHTQRAERKDNALNLAIEI